MTRYKLTIEYMGADYVGWQRQPDRMSVQQAIEDAIHAFSGQDVRITAAGRTDSGVHALGQVAHVDLDAFNQPMTPCQVCKAINARLYPQPITIIKAEVVDDDFHARFGAKNKLYRYRMINRYGHLNVDKGLAWGFKRPLDVPAMHEAAQRLVGQHDFSSFRDSDCQAKNPVRTIDRLDITARDYDGCGGQEIHIEAEAMAFLHHQMRNIVGTLTLVGQGKWDADDVTTALEARNRAAAGQTAPPDGLYLVRIEY